MSVTQAKRLPPSVAAPLMQVNGARAVPGHVYGLRAPGAVVRVGFDDPSYWRSVARRAQESIASELSLTFATDSVGTTGDDGIAVLSCVGRVVQALVEASGLPAAGTARVLAAQSVGAEASRNCKQWLLAVPSLVP